MGRGCSDSSIPLMAPLIVPSIYSLGFRLFSIPVPLEVRQIENNKWQAVPSAAVNATGISLAPGFIELAIKYRGETQPERDDPQSQKMVAAASTEIAGSIMGVVSSPLAVSFKGSE